MLPNNCRNKTSGSGSGWLKLSYRFSSSHSVLVLVGLRVVSSTCSVVEFWSGSHLSASEPQRRMPGGVVVVVRWARPVCLKPRPLFPELYIKAAGRPRRDSGQVCAGVSQHAVGFGFRQRFAEQHHGRYGLERGESEAWRSKFVSR